MAAPMVDYRASTVRGKKGNKSYYPVKNTITSPFLSEWPRLSHEDASIILQKVTSTFSPQAASLAKLPSKRKKKGGVSDEVKTKRAVLRSQLALGLNEVTRALEQGKLRLALVCPSAQPALMTNHLLTLGATRNTPVLRLQGLSTTLAPLLKLKVILAVGFKKITTADPATFDDLVNFIVAMTPPVRVPWLQYKELTLDELRQVVTNTVLRGKMANKSTQKQKGKGKGKNKGQGSSDIKAPDQAQTGSSSESQRQAGVNPDSGAIPVPKEETSKEAVPQNSVVAPDHAQAGASSNSQSQAGNNPNAGAIPKATEEAPIGADPKDTIVAPEHAQSSDIQIEAGGGLENLVQVGKLQQTDDNPARKRPLSGTPPGLSKKKAKMVLRPDYKPVTVLPVKIIPKDLKDKKQLKKKRKKNKKKK